MKLQRLSVFQRYYPSFYRMTYWDCYYKNLWKIKITKCNHLWLSIFLMGYAGWPFRELESYHSFLVGLNGNNIQIILKHLIKVLSLMKYLQAILQLKMIQRLFKHWEIMNGHSKLEMMILAWKQNLFWLILG